MAISTYCIVFVLGNGDEGASPPHHIPRVDADVEHGDDDGCDDDAENEDATYGDGEFENGGLHMTA